VPSTVAKAASPYLLYFAKEEQIEAKIILAGYLTR